MMVLVELKHISKSYNNHKVIKDFSLQIERGDYISITGASGKGKTTLLNIIGMLDKPDSGEVLIFNNRNPEFMSAQARKIRRCYMSYLFQNYGLIDSNTVEENLYLVTKFGGKSKQSQKRRIDNVLKQVGLEEYGDRKVFTLSGGEQQRVALAKIMLKSPDLILADEPTGSLDIANRDYVLHVLNKMNENGKTIVVVTHDPEVAKCAKIHICL